MKTCLLCSSEKETSEFGKDSSTSDGISRYCMSCNRLKGRRYRESNKASVRTKNKKYRESHKDEAKVLFDNWSKHNKDKIYASSLRSRAKYPERDKARRALRRAVASGKVAKLFYCEECCSDKNIEGHHEDYSKPLEVKWLCRKCHRSLHLVAENV